MIREPPEKRPSVTAPRLCLAGPHDRGSRRQHFGIPGPPLGLRSGLQFPLGDFAFARAASISSSIKTLLALQIFPCGNFGRPPALNCQPKFECGGFFDRVFSAYHLLPGFKPGAADKFSPIVFPETVKQCHRTAFFEQIFHHAGRASRVVQIFLHGGPRFQIGKKRHAAADL